METVLSLFWNRDQHRVTMVWRVIIEVIVWVLFIILIVLCGVLIYLPATLVLPDLTLDTDSMQIPLVFLAVVALISTTASMLLVGWFIDRRRFTDFGFHLNGRWVIDLGFGLALGAGLMILIFVIELAAGWIRIDGTFQSVLGLPFIIAIVGPLIAYICVGFYEEMLFRGYLIKNISEGLARPPWVSPAVAVWITVLLTSAIFGVAHAGNDNASFISTFNIFLAGIFLAMGYILTGELAIPIGVHITWNFFQGNIFGFPVSGTGSGPTVIAVEQLGNDLITGGAFGPEAGMIGIGAMLLGTILTVLWVRVRSGTTNIYPRLTVPDLRPRQVSDAEPQIAA